jgi:hypothetical protein
MRLGSYIEVSIMKFLISSKIFWQDEFNDIKKSYQMWSHLLLDYTSTLFFLFLPGYSRIFLKGETSLVRDS